MLSYDNWIASTTLDWDWLTLGAFCTSPVSSLYTRDKWSSFGGTSFKALHALLFENSCLHQQSSTSCPAWIWSNDQRFICPQAKWEREHDATPYPSHWSQVEAAMASEEIDAKLVCPLRIPSFPPGTHNYNPRITRWSLHWWLWNEWEIGGSGSYQPPFPEWWDNLPPLDQNTASTIFAAEATAIILALNYYQHTGPVHHDVIVYSDSMSCLQAIEDEDTENLFICHIMNLLWLLNDNGTHIRFCWIPSHCGIDGNERVDQLAKETIDHDKEWLQVCNPQVQSHTFHCTTVSGSETPHSEDWRHTSASGGVHKVPWAVVGYAPLI